MIRWRSGCVVEVGRRWATAVELRVELEHDVGERSQGTEVTTVRALAYADVVGSPVVGDVVLLNVTALDLELGTGGYALVAGIPQRLPADPDGPGHLVKARYTPLQMTVLGVDEQDSPHHDVLRDADDLAGMPVVVADLHSALPAVIAGLRERRPDATVVYVATDGGALPLAFSQTVQGLRDAGWLAGTITVGQTFGGDLEAVTVHNGLLAAHLVLEADVTVVAQGPGNLGTGTRWGFSGVAAGEAINATATLGGRPVAALRVSQADDRERHRGVSHHSLTAYGRVATHSADIPVPQLPGELGERVASQAATLSPPHHLVTVEVDGLAAALAASPVGLSTMGRGLDSDGAAFIASAAAGRHAASLLGGDRPRRPAA
ncbi:MAG: DUF3866 family protein [Actinomycetia bacterium]|nr:DUF3866 family protein [Actinomycetes bacterium]